MIGGKNIAGETSSHQDTLRQRRSCPTCRRSSLVERLDMATKLLASFVRGTYLHLSSSFQPLSSRACPRRLIPSRRTASKFDSSLRQSLGAFPRPSPYAVNNQQTVELSPPFFPLPRHRQAVRQPLVTMSDPRDPSSYSIVPRISYNTVGGVNGTALFHINPIY